MKAVEQVLQALQKLEQKLDRGISANEIGAALKMDRTNVSRYLNRLHEENRIAKLEGRPVLFCSLENQHQREVVLDGESSFDKLAAVQSSLHIPIQQAKAAILYPPRGLHTLLLGETGVGKSTFAELMHQFAVESGVVAETAPFIRFNCADYAENAQLLVSQIFGVKKGAYTGADRDREGLLKKADGGFLFLDEVHRLSPQGQEMLFTFIDKGSFRALGDAERIQSSEVRIVAATTEQPQSHLLNTFTRRIPMIIELPALKDKDLSERYYLIEHFIRQESKRIGKSIYADKNAVIAFLLYDCPNNIGQLKSDIQLSCAKAFVNFKAQKGSFVSLNISDLPPHVCKGIMKINEYRERIDYLIKNKSATVRFSFDELQDFEESNQTQVNEDFYDLIEQKLEALKNSGLKEEEISRAINLDIEVYFKKYMGELPSKIQGKDLMKLISGEIMAAAEDVLALAEQRLQRRYDQNILIGLALHLHSFVERVKKGVRIYHPKLNDIRIDYSEEFMTAMEAAKILDSSFKLHTPLDEIGYIAMFLSPKTLEDTMQELSKVGILLIMHGSSTASSMAEVCNTMIGVRHAEALDMPLTMSPKLMYEQAKEKVLQMDKGRGVLLMVDMGSLVTFGQMLQEETGIVIRVIDMTSTPIVLEACRKAVMGRDIHSIYESIKGVEGYPIAERSHEHKNRKNVIITACFTGEGASERMKRIIEESIPVGDTDVIALNILNRKEFISKVEQYKEKHAILAIVSTIDINITDIPLVSAAELLADGGLDRIREIIQTEQNYQKIAKSLKKHVQIDSEGLVESIRGALKGMEKDLGLQVREEVKVGMLLHISFLIDKLKAGGEETFYEGLEEYKKQYAGELALIRGHVRSLEAAFDVRIGDHEAAYICRMLLSNVEEEQESI